ncbi:(d)CMP kinase [Parasediminibacterium sp. JCM 36343]|uniref:(d)CMP kinase n=1 Tax=Parasediminibacterium sp. JCM 36343 TaxID=3374279 RepID=UPI00397BAE83
MKKIIITVDGYSSCGKSTLAKALAKKLNYVFIDSGAMYRAITFYFLRNNIDWNNTGEVIEALKNIHLSFTYNEKYGSSDILLNGENVETHIREMAISDKVSDVAAVKEVREFTVAQQQTNTASKGIVMDGRDIGTVVFPEAELKIFLTADPAVRVERRYAQIVLKDPTITREEIKKNLEMRDYLDSTREISPLRKAEDAIVLDNSHLTQQEQVDLVLQWANEKINS